MSTTSLHLPSVCALLEKRSANSLTIVVVVCVYSTLNSECKIQNVAGLSKAELFQLAQDAAEFVFAGDELKRSLRELFERVGKELTT